VWYLPLQYPPLLAALGILWQSTSCFWSDICKQQQHSYCVTTIVLADGCQGM